MAYVVRSESLRFLQVHMICCKVKIRDIIDNEVMNLSSRMYPREALGLKSHSKYTGPSRRTRNVKLFRCALHVPPTFHTELLCPPNYTLRTVVSTADLIS